MSADQTKAFADRATKTARETFEKGSAAAEDAARGAEQSYFAAAEGMRDFNVRLIEMAYANTVAALDLAREISTVRDRRKRLRFGRPMLRSSSKDSLSSPKS